MNEKEIYAELTRLTKVTEEWAESILWVEQYIKHPSLKISAKAIWLYGEMGLHYPEKATRGIPAIAALLKSDEPLLRERALNALGRTGRADFALVKSYLTDMAALSSDQEPKVRIAFIWACENIAASSPCVFSPYVPVFAGLLTDENERVRMEAPEIFRVLAKQQPEMVKKYRNTLVKMSEADENSVVRIHCTGAVKAIDKGGK